MKSLKDNKANKFCCKCKKEIIRKNKGQRISNLCRQCYKDPKTKHQYQLSKIGSLKTSHKPSNKSEDNK